MPKIEQRLMEARFAAIAYLFHKQYTIEEIGRILHLTKSAVYHILKKIKEKEIII